MCPDRKSRWASFVGRMAVDEHGVLTVEEARTLIVPAKLFQHLQQAGERFLGRGWVGIIYSAGEELGRFVAEGLRSFAGPRTSSEALMQMVFESGELRGFGPIQLLDVDIAAGRGTLRYLACPFDEDAGTKTRSSCPLSAGFFAGVFAALRHAPVQAEETACISKGDPYCECAAYPLVE